MACCSGCARNILFVLNILDTIFGIVLCVCGAVLLLRYNKDGAHIPFALWGSFFAVGGLLLLVVFLSECGKCCIRAATGPTGGVACACFLNMSSYLGAFVGFLEIALALGTLFSHEAVEELLGEALPSPHTLAGSGTFCCGGPRRECAECIKPETFTVKFTEMEFKFPPKDPTTSETKVALNFTIDGKTYQDELPYEYSDLTLEPTGTGKKMVDDFVKMLHCEHIGTISNHPEDLR